MPKFSLRVYAIETPNRADDMRFEILFLGLGLAGQAYAQTCGWFLNPDDCICMMSTTGGLLKEQTSYCCRAMGYKMTSNVRAA